MRRSRPGRASWTTCSAPPRRMRRSWPICHRRESSGSWCTRSAPCSAAGRSPLPCCSSSTTSTGPIRPAWRSWRSSSTSCRTCASRCSRRTDRTGRTAGRAAAATSRSTFARCGLTTRVAWPPSWRRAQHQPRRSQSGSSSGPAATRSSWRSSSTASAAQRPDQARRLPASIHEMLLARLDALPADARRVLQLASVVGMEFDEPIVAALAETDAAATDEAFRTLQRTELVQATGGATTDRALVFRHPLIHEVAYGSLLTSTRRKMHGRVGRWLEENGGEERVDELARHYEHSDDRERARRYLRLAGERAHALNATREAFDWFIAAADASSTTRSFEARCSRPPPRRSTCWASPSGRRRSSRTR